MPPVACVCTKFHENPTVASKVTWGNKHRLHDATAYLSSQNMDSRQRKSVSLTEKCTFHLFTMLKPVTDLI
jgi:hypothetical protein